MNRDIDFVRRILISIEQSDANVFDASRLVDDDHDAASVLYHVELLRDAGYIDTSIVRYLGGGGRALIKRMTWAGHEYLDAVRDDTVWSRTKSRIAETVGSASLEVVKAVAGATAKEMFGLS